MTRSNAALMLLCLAAVAFQSSAGFKIVDCGGKTPLAQLDSIKIGSCPDAKGERCIFKRGTNSTLEIDFTPRTTFSKANVSIFGKVGPLWLPFPMDGPTDACGNYGFDCPVEAGQLESFSLDMMVKQQFPVIKTTCRVALENEKKQKIICIQFPVQIVA